MSLLEARATLQHAIEHHAYTDLGGVETVRVRTSDLATVLAQPAGVTGADEDWLEEVISDTLDMDWQPRWAARAILTALEKEGWAITAAAPPAPSPALDEAAIVERCACVADAVASRPVQAPEQGVWERAERATGKKIAAAIRREGVTAVGVLGKIAAYAPLHRINSDAESDRETMRGIARAALAAIQPQGERGEGVS